MADVIEQKADIVVRLREPVGQFGKSMVLCSEAADAIDQMMAALKAQDAASAALEGRVGFEEYRALQDNADKLRRAALASPYSDQR